MTNEQLLTKFQSYLLTEKRVSPNTFDAYSRDIRQFLLFLSQTSTPIDQIEINHLKQFVHFLHKQGTTARSIARKISSLKSLCSYLQRIDIVQQNYAEQLVMPKIEKKLPQYLSENEVQLLFEIADQDTSTIGQRNKMMIYLLYVTGMRVSELVGLRVRDVQFDTAFIRISGKGGKERHVPIPEAMLTLLREYTAAKQRAESGRDEHLFSCRYKKKVKQLTRQTCWSILKKLWKKAGIDREVWPHQLRHSFATHMLKKGANVRSLQMLLGHESLATVQTYTHLQTGYLRLIYNKKHPRS